MAEEFFFRGFLYPVLARSTGVSGAVWLTTGAFTLLHGAQLAFSWAALVPILFVGLVLTTIRAVTKSVALSVLVHAAYNATVLGMALISTHGFHEFPHS
jgi:membrane protease YdiL (CAAX protease family)